MLGLVRLLRAVECETFRGATGATKAEACCSTATRAITTSMKVATSRIVSLTHQRATVGALLLARQNHEVSHTEPVLFVALRVKGHEARSSSRQ
jgi:hypothetical protein